LRLRPAIDFVGGESDYRERLSGDLQASRRELERHLAVAHAEEEEFTLPGVCAVDGSVVDFLVDRKWGGARGADGIWVPSWRERIECPLCHLNNRQRAMAATALAEIEGRSEAPRAPVLYCMEQVTAMFLALRAQCTTWELIGSEYLGPRHASGDVVDGLRHEDAEAMSLEDASVDVVLSNEVFEHVAAPRRALAEAARVLRPSGVMLFSIPFDPRRQDNRTRARLEDGELVHLEPPEVHGNPMSADGSLVFTDFGWELLDWVRDAGFRTCRGFLYWDYALGHLGVGDLLFHADR
jgi:SAM-dependent methyltransferase